MEIKARVQAIIDTDRMTVTLITPKTDASNLANQITETIRLHGGLKGMNGIVKTIVESKVMNWVGSLVARGWVDFMPDSKNWKIILKRGE